jgi:integrase
MKEALSIIEPEDNAKKIFDNLDVSEATRKDYSYRIGAFVSFVSESGMNRNSFLDFKKYLAGRNDLSTSAKNKNLSVARIFLQELSRLGYLPSDVTLNIRSFTQGRAHKKEGLSPDEVARIAERINAMPDVPRNNRLRALFCLLAFQGLRQCEIVRLNVEDINLISKTALVWGKGRDDKEIVHLAPNTVEVLRNYIASNKIKAGGFFKGMGRRKTDRMSTRTIKREFGYLFNELKIRKTTHGFRHWFVSTLLSNKLDARVVMKFSRHANVNTVLIYDDERDLVDRSKEVFRCFEDTRLL